MKKSYIRAREIYRVYFYINVWNLALRKCQIDAQVCRQEQKQPCKWKLFRFLASPCEGLRAVCRQVNRNANTGGALFPGDRVSSASHSKGRRDGGK